MILIGRPHSDSKNEALIVETPHIQNPKSMLNSARWILALAAADLGVSNNSGPFLGVRMIRNIMFLGVYMRAPISGNSHVELAIGALGTRIPTEACSPRRLEPQAKHEADATYSNRPTTICEGGPDYQTYKTQHRESLRILPNWAW